VYLCCDACSDKGAALAACVAGVAGCEGGCGGSSAAAIVPVMDWVVVVGTVMMMTIVWL